MVGGERRAEAVRVPEASPELVRVMAERRLRHDAAEKRQRVSAARGLVALAVVALLASMVRAGLSRVFVHGWWRQW
jgi:hypothetical protein